MASAFSLTKQRLRESISGSKRTCDPRFDEAIEHITILAEQMRKIQLELKAFTESLKQYQSASHTIANEFLQMYNTEATGMTDSAAAFESYHAGLQTKMEKMDDHLGSTIKQKIDAWLTQLDQCEEDMKAREECRLKYDHYKDKYEGLCSHRDSVRAKGQAEDPKHIDRLRRNEQKLEIAKEEFHAKNNTLVEKLQTMWNERFALLDPALAELVKTEYFLFTAMSKSLTGIANQTKLALSAAPPRPGAQAKALAAKLTDTAKSAVTNATTAAAPTITAVTQAARSVKPPPPPLVAAAISSVATIKPPATPVRRASAAAGSAQAAVTVAASNVGAAAQRLSSQAVAAAAAGGSALTDAVAASKPTLVHQDSDDFDPFADVVKPPSPVDPDDPWA